MMGGRIFDLLNSALREPESVEQPKNGLDRLLKILLD
jgi:hypothetical protein